VLLADASQWSISLSAVSLHMAAAGIFRNTMKYTLYKSVALAAFAFFLGVSAHAAADKDGQNPGGVVPVNAAPAAFAHSVRDFKPQPAVDVLPAEGPRITLSTSQPIPKAGSPIARPDASKPNAATQTQSTLAAQATASFTPLCTTLGINTAYSFTGAQAGGAYCFHFAITQKAKTTLSLGGQSANTNFVLYLLKDDGLNNLSVVGSSDAAGNANEAVQAITEPGNYYWYMVAHTADASSVSFGSTVNTPIDDYEINDTLAQSKALPDRLNVITGNSDSTTDYDYYHFTAIRGQVVRIALVGVVAGSSNKWIAEYYTGSNWAALGVNVNNEFSGLPQNTTVYIRVRPNPAVAWSAAAQYTLTFGSKPVMSSYGVSGEYNVLRIPYAASTAYGYMTTQAMQQLTWAMTLTDTKGAPLVGLSPTLHLVKRQGDSETAYSLTGNSAGVASGIVNLGACSGDFQTEFDNYANGYLNTWRTDYTSGYWYLRLAEALDVGVGGTNVEFVTFGQICRQTLIRSVKS
jgi:hypothetical protein